VIYERILAAIMLASLTFGSGLQVNRTHLVEILKNAGLLVRVLIANFLIVPAAGYGLAKLFRLPIEVETGFLLMVIAPGVPFVLAQVRKRGGRLALAVEMALVLPLLSILTIPITAALVLPAGASAHIPLAQFLVTLVLFQFVPLLLGMVVGERLPAAAQRLGKPLQIVFFAAVIALIAVMAPKLVHDVTLVYGSNGMWAMLCVVLVSLGAGWLLGGPAREDRRVLSLGTALRNVGLGALVATSNFRSEQVAATVITYFLIQFILVTILGAYFTKTAKAAVA
jgi:bile acid:Na+ symporter, BASS family